MKRPPRAVTVMPGSLVAGDAGASGFPLWRALLLTSLVATCLLLGAWCLSWSFEDGRDPFLSAVFFAVALVWALHVVSYVAIASLAVRGLMPLLYGCFGIMGLRMISALAVSAIAARAWDLPGRPLAAGLAASYLPLLALEVFIVIRHVKRVGHVHRGSEVSVP